jgi:hypothetical protein
MLDATMSTPLKGLYRSEKPKYKMAPSDSTITLEFVSSTDKAQSEVSEWVGFLALVSLAGFRVDLNGRVPVMGRFGHWLVLTD